METVQNCRHETIKPLTKFIHAALRGHLIAGVTACECVFSCPSPAGSQ